MANRFWVGGGASANWNATGNTNWAASSGGANNASVPGSSDDVFFDANSGAGNSIISAAITINSLNCTGYTGTITHNATFTLSIGSGTAGASNVALLFVSGMTYTLGSGTTSAIAFISTSATQQTITTGTKVLGNVSWNASSNGSWILQDGLTSTGGTLTLTHGTINLNGQAVNCSVFNSSGALTRTLTMGNSTITGSSGGSFWNTGTNTALTITANTATAVGSSATCTFAGGGTNFNGMSLSLPGSATATITGANTFANLNRTGTAAQTSVLALSASQTITGTLTLAGNATTKRLLVQSSTLGTPMTLTCNGTLAISNADFQDITGAGSVASPWDLTAVTGLSGDCGGNSGINFTLPAAQTWSGTTGNWSTNAWTSRVPLPQDNVTINLTSGTATADVARLGKNIANTSGAGTIAFNSTPNAMYGDLTLGFATISGTQALTLSGRGSQTITCNGKSFSQSVFVSAFGGTYTFADTFSTPSGLTLAAGTLTTNNQTVTCSSFTSNGAIAGTLNLGSSTFNLTATAAVNVWDGSTATINAGTSTIVIQNTSVNTRTFVGAGATYHDLTYTVAGSTGALAITGANTFNTINFSDVTNARTLTLPAGIITTITGSNLNVNGTSGKLMTINSSSSGTQATLFKSSGTVSCDFLDLHDSAATGGAIWYAGANSTGLVGQDNSGWNFSAPVGGAGQGYWGSRL